MKKPNIVLICVDQMRGDCLKYVGHPVVETPYLDTMAQNGILFRNAYSAVPSCIAARAALMTGMSQEKNGRIGYQDGVIWDYENTLAGGLTEAGYHTQCVGKMHVHPQRYLCGFNNVILHDGYLHVTRNKNVPYNQNQYIVDDYMNWLRSKKGTDADLIDTGLECNSWVSRPWMYEEELHPTNWVVTESIDFLRRRDPTKPFFLMPSFVRPHSPLDPPEFYFNMYKDKEIDKPKIGDWSTKSGRIPRFDDIRGELSESEYKRLRQGYYGCITHIDHQIGRLIQALIDEGEINNTIIIFTSDHGDLLGDHNFFRKSLPYEGSANIPLIIYDRGNILNLKPGTIIDEVVELRDIMPTIYDISNIPIPETVDGLSLLPLMKGENTSFREYLHGEHEYGNMSNHYIVTKKDKYILFPETNEEQYFDLEADRDELHNAINDEAYQARIEVLRSVLKESCKR